jgi:putative acetyltransferase
MPAEIRTMTIDDYDRVLRLWSSSEGVAVGEDDSREKIAAYLSRNAGLSVAAEEGGEIVGAILSGHDGRRGYLHHLAVAKKFRRQGLGRRLVDECLKRLAREKIPRCHIFVFIDNAEALRFWRAAGWEDRRKDIELMTIQVLPPET